jgi:hypothetical protein
MTLKIDSGYAPVDEYYDNVSLLLYGNGTNNSTTIIDSSPNGKTRTVFDNARISTLISKFGGSSLFFDGTNDYISFPYSPTNDLGTGDFTIEAFIYVAGGSSDRGFIGLGNVSATSGVSMRINGNDLRFFVDGYDNQTTTSNVIIGSTWYHVALVRSGTTNRIYVDGISGGSNTRTPNFGSGTTLVIGRTYSDFNGEYWNGYIDEVRITKGVARYTSNFTPPTEQFPDLSPTGRLAL